MHPNASDGLHMSVCETLSDPQGGSNRLAPGKSCLENNRISQTFKIYFYFIHSSGFYDFKNVSQS